MSDPCFTKIIVTGNAEELRQFAKVANDTLKNTRECHEELKELAGAFGYNEEKGYVHGKYVQYNFEEYLNEKCKQLDFEIETAYDFDNEKLLLKHIEKYYDNKIKFYYLECPTYSDYFTNDLDNIFFKEIITVDAYYYNEKQDKLYEDLYGFEEIKAFIDFMNEMLSTDFKKRVLIETYVDNLELGDDYYIEIKHMSYDF